MNITYDPSFEHRNWLDNEDIVQAGGENGMNKRFIDLRADLDAISATFTTANQEVDDLSTRIDAVEVLAGQGLQTSQVITHSVQLNPNASSSPLDVEVYTNADVPGGVKKVYHVGITPIGTHGQVSSHFIYTAESPTQTRVQVWFKNELNQIARIAADVIALS